MLQTLILLNPIMTIVLYTVLLTTVNVPTTSTANVPTNSTANVSTISTANVSTTPQPKDQETAQVPSDDNTLVYGGLVAFIALLVVCVAAYLLYHNKEKVRGRMITAAREVELGLSLLCHSCWS